MAITVRIPTALRPLTGGLDEVSTDAGSVQNIIVNLDATYPGLKERLCDDKGVRRSVNIFANEEDIRFLDNLETELKDGESLDILPAIAGG